MRRLRFSTLAEILADMSRDTVSVRAITSTIAAGLAAFGLLSCALVFVSTDGLSGGADDTEAGAPAVGDGAVGADGHAEGGVLPDGGSTTDADAGFCASNPGHTLCEDFDDHADVTTGWSPSTRGRGVVRADTMVSRSAPRSFLSETSAGTKLVSTATMYRDVGTTTRIRFAFDVFVTAPPGSVGDSFAEIHFPNGYLTMLWFTDGTFWLSEAISPANIDHVSTQPIGAGKWVRVFVESTPGHIVASVDGVTAVDVTTTSTAFQGPATVSLGLYSNDTYAIGFNFDNIVVDTSF